MQRVGTVLGVAAGALTMAALAAAGEVTGGAVAAGSAAALGFLADRALAAGGDRRERAERAAALARAASPLPGPPPEGEPPGGELDPARLLQAERAVVEFTGRVAELARLRSWCADSAPASVALVTGPGGVGKTRLALRLAEELGSDWTRLQVHRGHEAEVVAAYAESRTPTLLLVDYAETRDGLGALLGTLGTARPRSVLRILLLAREAGEWWERLTSRPAPVAGLLARATRLRLGAVAVPESSDEDLMRAALPYFARALGVPPPDVRLEPGADERPSLLVLHTAALVAVLAGAETPDRTVRVVADLGVLDELLTHETRYWYDCETVVRRLVPV